MDVVVVRNTLICVQLWKILIIRSWRFAWPSKEVIRKPRQRPVRFGVRTNPNLHTRLSAKGICRKGRRARRRTPYWKERPPTKASKGEYSRGISKIPTPALSPAARAKEGRPSFRPSLCCSRACFTCPALRGRTEPAICWDAPSTPIVAGKRLEEEMA